jgi:hypothetical protein
MNPPPKVLIVYSHDSPDHVARVRQLADSLRRDGVNVQIDQYHLLPKEGWSSWLEQQLGEATFVLLVCTELFYRRFRGDNASGIGLGAHWEGALLEQSIFENRESFEARHKTTK